MSDQKLTLGCTPLPGIYYNVPDDIYFSLNATSKSDLDLIHKSPATFRANKLGLVPERESRAMKLGKALHCYVLQPKEFNRLYARPLTRQACEEQGIKLADDRDRIIAMVNDLNQSKEQEMISQGIIMETEALADMISEVNKTRMPKLPASGSRDELIARIKEAYTQHLDLTCPTDEAFAAMKGTDLKAEIATLNGKREGLLSASGSRADLTERLREAGQIFSCKWEILDDFAEKNGRPYMLGSGCSRHEMIEWLNAEGYKGGNWKMWDQVMAEWQENNPGREMLSDEMFAQLDQMRFALTEHKTASKLLWPEKGMKGTEVVIVWVDESTGELCRAKIDALRFNGLPVDLKTTNDASADGFRKSVQNYGYDRQEAHYLNGLETLSGARPPYMPFICIESEPPYLVAVHVLGGKYKDIGNGQITDDLALLKRCRDNNTWPGYSEDAQTLDPQAWYEAMNAQHISEDTEWKD